MKKIYSGEPPTNFSQNCEGNKGDIVPKRCTILFTIDHTILISYKEFKPRRKFH